MVLPYASSYIVGVLVVAGGIFAMSAVAMFDDNSGIQLSCQVDTQQFQMQEKFEEDFCNALAGYLEDETATMIVPVSGDDWVKEGDAVRVGVRVDSKSGAGVTITSGRIVEGMFIGETAVEMSLFVSDGPLTPLSSRALVKGVGVQLGLIG